jgi:hypothetical protein
MRNPGRKEADHKCCKEGSKPRSTKFSKIVPTQTPNRSSMKAQVFHDPEYMEVVSESISKPAKASERGEKQSKPELEKAPERGKKPLLSGRKNDAQPISVQQPPCYDCTVTQSACSGKDCSSCRQEKKLYIPSFATTSIISGCKTPIERPKAIARYVTEPARTPWLPGISRLLEAAPAETSDSR